MGYYKSDAKVSTYAKNDAQEIRKQNYLRYKKMSMRGYSISDESAQTALYYINDDPFGRAYYLKSLGQVAVQDPITGELYTQEEWATKEFIIDNKAQLINKVSADLVIGQNLNITFANPDELSEEDIEWLQETIEYNKLQEKVYEDAIQNSSLGDIYFELSIVDNKVDIQEVDPYFVDIDYSGKKVKSYEIAWLVDIGRIERKGIFKRKSDKNKEFIQKRIHYPGMIRYELYEVSPSDKHIMCPLIKNLENEELIEKALKAPHMKCLITEDQETDNPEQIYVIEEYTGVDECLLVHWPNYRMFGVYGVSDTGMIESLQNCLNNRRTQLNDVLDKHGDPPMYGDPSYLDTNGNLVMGGGGGRFFPVTQGGQAPGYLEWTGHLADSKQEIQDLYKSILENSEVSPALLGNDEGGIESGRALMYKLIRSLCMKARKFTYLKSALQNIFRIAQKLRIVWLNGEGLTSTDEEINPEQWKDNIFKIDVNSRSSLPTDTESKIKDVTEMVKNKLISKDTGTKIVSTLFDEIDYEEEIKKMENERQKQIEVNQSEIPDIYKSM